MTQLVVDVPAERWPGIMAKVAAVLASPSAYAACRRYRRQTPRSVLIKERDPGD